MSILTLAIINTDTGIATTMPVSHTQEQSLRTTKSQNTTQMKQYEVGHNV